MTKIDDNNKFEIGYSRPPRHSRFVPGQSGNPRGRQKGVRNLATDVKRTLEAPVKLTEQGKTKCHRYWPKGDQRDEELSKHLKSVSVS